MTVLLRFHGYGVKGVSDKVSVLSRIVSSFT